MAPDLVIDPRRRLYVIMSTLRSMICGRVIVYSDQQNLIVVAFRSRD
jgi:hypothetical protein